MFETIKILTKEKFSSEVEDLIFNREHEIFEALIVVCERHQLELEGVRKFLTRSLLDLVENEARKNKLLK